MTSCEHQHPSSPPGSGTPNQLSALGIHFQPDQQLRPLTSSPEDSKQGSSMSSPPSSGSPLPSNTNVLVTQDGFVAVATAICFTSACVLTLLLLLLLNHIHSDTMAKCDLGGSTGGHMIREKILAKLRIDDSEHGRCSIHRGRFLAGQEGPPLSSEDLWNGCQQMAPTGGNPPLFFVSVDGPTTGTTPLVSPGNVLYPIENKVASPEAEDTSTLGSTHLMRSARPKWHKARSSDPESSGPRSPPMLPNGAANPPNPSHLRTPSHPVPSTLSNQHASSSSPSSSSAAPRPQSPTANSLSPENHSRFGSGGRRLSEGSEAQRSAELKAVQYRVLAARKPSAEALQDSRQREYLTNPPHSSPLPESHWPSSSSGNPAFSQSTGSSSSRDGSGRDVPAWEAMQRHHQQKQARKARQDSTDEQMRPNQRLEWDHYNRNMPSQSSGLPPSSSGHHSPAHSNGLPPPPLHPMMHHQGSSSMGPAGYGASGPVFRSPHPPAQPGRYVNAGMTPAGFGPNGPTGARLGLPSSVRPAPAAPSNHSARHALQPGMKVPPQLSQQGPIPPPPQRGHPQLQPPPGRPLHAARSVDDLRHRPRPSRHDIPPMPNASRAPPLNAQSGSSSRWAQPPPMRPGTAIPTNRPSDFNGHMPFPGNSGPPMPPSPMPPPGPVNRQRPGQPARSQPNNVPASLQSGSRPQPQQQQQDPALSRHPLPVQMSPRPSQQRNADVTLSVQTDLVRSPATYELAGSAYKRSPVSGGNSAKRDAQNPFPLPASGNKPQSQDAGAGRAAPSTMELPANLRPGPSRMNAASRRQNNSSDGVLSPSSATRPINQGPPSPGGLSPAVDRPFAAPSSPTQSRFPNTRPRASSSSEVHSRSPVDATSSNSRQVSSPADARHERAGSAPAVDESYPPLPPAHVEPTAPPLWEDDLPEFSTVLASEGSTTSHNNRFSEEDQSTVKGDEWATIVRKIQENGADVDTLVPYATGPFPDDAGFATLSPVAERRTDPLAGSSSQEAAPSRGQFGCSMDDFDSDDDDERTWAVAPGTAKPKELQAIRAANAAKQESPSTPKPSLSLQIENLPSSRRAAAEASSDSPPKSRPLDPTANSEGGDDQWAVRPSVERVYDNLERFFPDHDLDKPIVDANAAPVNSPTSPPAVSAPQTTAAPTPPEPQRFRHKKSIRIIAQDRKRLLQRAESAVSRAVDGAATRASGLLRRKSTKLWGIRTEEVTPRQAKLAGTTSGPPLVAEPAPDAESGQCNACGSLTRVADID